MYGKLNVTTSMPSADSAEANSTMNVLRCPAPAPCARISEAPAPAPAAAAAWTIAVVPAPVCGLMVSSLGFFKGDLDLGVGLQFVRHRQRAELRRERSRQHPIDLALHDAGERHPAVLDDDVNRR